MHRSPVTLRKPSATLGALCGALLLAALLIAIAPSSAAAGGTALLGKGPGQTLTYGGLSFGGVSGETNRVTIALRDLVGDLYLNDDGGSVNQPGSPCIRFASSQTMIKCPGTWPAGFNGAGHPINEFNVRLGSGGASTFTIADPQELNLPFGQVSGGAQRDVVTIGRQAGISAGRFIVQGHGGNDQVIIGNHGTGNILSGGPGDDLLSTFRNGRRDEVACGTGVDTAYVDLQDTASALCEIVHRAPKDQHPIVGVRGSSAPVTRGQARVRLTCPKDATSDCRGRLRILRGAKGDKTLGTARYSVRKGAKGTVRVKVSDARGVVRVTTREPGSEVGPKTGSTRVQLRRG